MNNCPNCGTNISAGQTWCSCGELLRADLTHHLQPWETETIFRSKAAVRWSRVAAVTVSAIAVAIVLVLSWPQLITSWKTTDGPDTANVGQPSSPPDIIRRSDLTENDQADVDQEGVFDFSKRDRPQSPHLKATSRQTGDAAPKTTSAPIADDTYDAQLLDDGSSAGAAVGKDEKTLPDCKPAIDGSLKHPDAQRDNDPKPQSKQSAINYILGPRGGCYFVTASGSKKYVDHSMCAASTAAASRQD